MWGSLWEGDGNGGSGRGISKVFGFLNKEKKNLSSTLSIINYYGGIIYEFEISFVYNYII